MELGGFRLEGLVLLGGSLEVVESNFRETERGWTIPQQWERCQLQQEVTHPPIKVNKTPENLAVEPVGHGRGIGQCTHIELPVVILGKHISLTWR